MRSIDFLWRRLMQSSVGILVVSLGQFWVSNGFKLDEKTILIFISIFSFSLFFARIYRGDSNYGEVSERLGIAAGIENCGFPLKYKQLIDSGLLAIQAVGFLFLGWFVRDPSAFAITFFFVLFINILWLLYQNYSIITISGYWAANHLKSRIVKHEHIFIKKVKTKLSLLKIINIWLFNNIIFAFIAGLTWWLYYAIETDEALAIGLLLTILNSIIDFYFTWDFYNLPEDFIYTSHIH